MDLLESQLIQPFKPKLCEEAEWSGIVGVVHLGGESSKLLFDTLAQWNQALSQTSIAGILPAANSNEVAHDDDSSSNGGTVPLDPNVVGIDLSARRPQRPTYRGPKKRHSGDDAMEVGHG